MSYACGGLYEYRGARAEGAQRMLHENLFWRYDFTLINYNGISPKPRLLCIFFLKKLITKTGMQTRLVCVATKLWASYRYVKGRVVHAPGIFTPPPRFSDPNMHHGTCVTHVRWCMPASLMNGFLCSGWRGKRSRHPQCTRNQQFYVSGKRPIQFTTILIWNTYRKKLYFQYWESRRLL